MTQPLWDAEVLARIRQLQLVARRVVDGVLVGGHRSRRVGADIEFADHKEYAPGDSPRDIDWKVLARSERLVVKRYQLETELSCALHATAGTTQVRTERPTRRCETTGAM